nr:hypothetical protein [Pseudomonas fragi]
MNFTKADRWRQHTKTQITFLKQCDGASSANTLPRQAKHQSLKLFGVQFHFATLSNTWPVKLTLVQPSCGQSGLGA